jgi:hypothetical protein
VLAEKHYSPLAASLVASSLAAVASWAALAYSLLEALLGMHYKADMHSSLEKASYIEEHFRMDCKALLNLAFLFAFGSFSFG